MEKQIAMTNYEIYELELAFEMISHQAHEISSNLKHGNDCTNSVCLLADYSKLLKEKMHNVLVQSGGLL